MNVISAPKEIPRHPCNPSPCGPNAICREKNGAGSCTCVNEYYGDPYLGCRPECVMNTDCATDRACFNNKCVDPCPGTCGQNAECRVTNHAPSCYCLPGFNGNPLHACSPIPSKTFFLFMTVFILDFIGYYIYYFSLFLLFFSSTRRTCGSMPPFTLWSL